MITPLTGSLGPLGRARAGVGGNAPAEPLLLDHFTALDGTVLTAHSMDVGPGWTTPLGAWQIQSNAAIGGGGDTHAASDSGAADVTVAATITLQGDFPALIARWSDLHNFWMLLLTPGTTYLFKRVADSYLVATSASNSWTTGIAYPVTLTCQGTHFVGVVAGHTDIDWDAGDTFNETATGCGMRSSGAAATYDDFTVVAA